MLKFTKNANTVAEITIDQSIVETMNIKLNSITPEYLFYGNIKSMNEVEIISKLKGKVIVVSPKVLNSSTFKKGEVIFQIDNFKFEKELLKQKSRLKELKSELDNTTLIYKEVLKQLNLSQKDYSRKKKLYGDIVTKETLDNSLLNLSLAKSKELNSKVKMQSIQTEIAIIKAQIEIEKRNFNDTKYKAPFDGKVSNSLIEVGAEVSTGKTLGNFINTSLLNIEFFVGESIYADLGNVIGREIKIFWRNSSFKSNYIGKVYNIDSTINKERSGLNMYAKLEDIKTIDPIRPGVFVEVLIKGKTIENALLIDENFIYEDNFIFILKDAFPIKRKIKIKGAIGNKLIITGNIIDDEKLITTRLTNFSKSKKLYSKNKNAN
ncbi:efflux RND transporter periplasmic adaptor subunit [Alphaproteobacteria bacterium]|nr:efflux RND transporter periplasmic adaptor subunit [Alphaproteobacteria bacterium]